VLLIVGRDLVMYMFCMGGYINGLG